MLRLLTSGLPSPVYTNENRSGPSGPAEAERRNGRSAREKEDILSALGDSTSRRILLTLDPSPLPVHDLVRALDLPQSTVYHKLHELERAGLVAIQSVPLTPEGKRVELFRSLVKSVRMELDAGKVNVKVRYRNLGSGPFDIVLRALGRNIKRQRAPTGTPGDVTEARPYR